ncbi:hypothetical protein Tco_1440303 [Tanacetum coccineum]
MEIVAVEPKSQGKRSVTSPYTERFQELTLICTKFVANETEKIDKYLSGLPDNIYGNVKAAKPKTLDEIIELANDLIDQKLLTYAERQSDNKRKADDSSRNNHGHQQQPFKRQMSPIVFNMGQGERKRMGDPLPKCQQFHLHHIWPVQQKVHKCNKIGHFAAIASEYGGNTMLLTLRRAIGGNSQRKGCLRVAAQDIQRDCPKLKNKNGGNGNAQGWVYAVGNAEKRGNAPGNPDANVVMVTLVHVPYGMNFELLRETEVSNGVRVPDDSDLMFKKLRVHWQGMPGLSSTDIR